MKKTVILILILLPIVLVITIAFAGKILSLYHHIPVEKVEFIDDVGDALDDNYILILNVDETKPTEVRIFPERASNRFVSYRSQDETICTVDASGNVTGVAVGSTTVHVETNESAKTDTLTVLVVADAVTGITLPSSEMVLIVGENSKLSPTIEPYAAINKGITYESSDPSIVSVSPGGQLIALAEGTATITVTTHDGGFTATCTLTVIDGTPPLAFDMSTANATLNGDGTGYILNDETIDLASCLQYDETKIDPATIQWRLTSGHNVATLTDTSVTFKAHGVAIITVYVGNAEAPTYQAQIKVFH